MLASEFAHQSTLADRWETNETPAMLVRIHLQRHAMERHHVLLTHSQHQYVQHQNRLEESALAIEPKSYRMTWYCDLPPPPPPPPPVGVKSSRLSLASLAFNCPAQVVNFIHGCHIVMSLDRSLVWCFIPKWKDVFLFFWVRAISDSISLICTKWKLH